MWWQWWGCGEEPIWFPMFLIIKGIRPHFPLSLCIYLGRVVSGIWVSIPAFCPSYCHNTIKTALVPNTSHYRKYHVMVDLLTPSCKFSYSHHMDTTVTIIICFCIKFPPPCHILDYFLCYIIDNGIYSFLRWNNFMVLNTWQQITIQNE